jgi:hypothetical protein
VLARTFKQTKKFLGDEKFGRLAESFIEKSPPSNPYLCLYGKEFPNFLEEPLLTDLARLEWCLQESLNAYIHSENDFPVKLAQINPEDFERLTFVLNPSIRLFKSVYNFEPLFTKDFLDSEDYVVGKFYFLCKAKELKAFVHALSENHGIFLEALERGGSLKNAYEQAMSCNENFNLPETLAYHFREKSFVDFKFEKI